MNNAADTLRKYSSLFIPLTFSPAWRNCVVRVSEPAPKMGSTPVPDSTKAHEEYEKTQQSTFCSTCTRFDLIYFFTL